MSQFRSTYVSPHAQSIAARIRPVAPKPAPKLEAAAKVRKVSAVAVTPNSSKAVTKNANGSPKLGRPRVLSDDQRRERVRRRVAGWRAAQQAKAGS